jgi:hypothetical protein
MNLYETFQDYLLEKLAPCEAGDHVAITFSTVCDFMHWAGIPMCGELVQDDLDRLGEYASDMFWFRYDPVPEYDPAVWEFEVIRGFFRSEDGTLYADGVF